MIGDTPPSPEAREPEDLTTSDLVPIAEHAFVEAAADPIGFEVSDERVTGLVYWPRALVREMFGVEADRVRRITITGESMAPTLQPGQKVYAVLNEPGASPVSGAVYFIQGPYGLIVKRVVVGSVPADDGRSHTYVVSLVSDNDDERRYPTETYPLRVFQQDFALLAHVVRAELAL